MQDNANQRLKVKLEAVGEALQDDYEVVFELVTTGKLTKSASDDYKFFQERITEIDHPSSSILLVDESILSARWDEALAKESPSVSHTFDLEPGKFLTMDVAGFKTVLAAVRLADCLKLPHIKDGLLFRKNVRQSLGLTNKVNKGLKQTLSSDTPQHFFLYHNGITALCEKLKFDTATNKLMLDGLSIVNGCQSLNTVLACSEKVRGTDSYVLFRFYEIPQRDVADKISINTNSQSAVKPRDLRSNDKRVLALKSAFQLRYRDGYLITKRGEERPADRDADKTIDIALLAKCLLTWHCQRPNTAYNENALFDKFFEKLFHSSNYPPEDILALNQWVLNIDRRWKENSLGLNEVLMAVPSFARFHLLFAIQACFCAASNQRDKVPQPSATNTALHAPDPIILMAANCFNLALDTAVNEYQEKNKIFSPPNWLKNKDSITKIQAAVTIYASMINSLPGGAELKTTLTLPSDKFMARWQAE